MTITTRRHVLFDLDGTLVDTREAVLECYTRVFRERLDRDFPPDDFPTDNLFAMRPPEVFAFVAPDRVEELHAAYRETYPRCIESIKVFEGIREMVTGLAASGRSVSLVTNKGIERTLIDLRVAGIPPETFTAIVTAEDTVERKPHPAPILLGLERAGAEAADAIYVGDGPQDIRAARNAGMPVVAVAYGFYDRSELSLLEPDSLVDTPAALSDALGVPPSKLSGAAQ
jgi:HAD superfamily hydrolase (TIGR01509 family)